MMTLLLPTHTAFRTRPTMTEDEHGWVLPDGGETITVQCSLQLASGVANVTANETGGAGPYQPRVVMAANVYTAPTADVMPGDILTIDGADWQVRTAMDVPDPSGGDAGCRVMGVEV